MRLDDEVKAVAERIAQAERRSITSVMEVALMEYAERHGFAEPPQPVTIKVNFIGPDGEKASEGPSFTVEPSAKKR